MSQEVLTVADHEQAAQARLSPECWAYFAGGAGDEHTLRRNQIGWTHWQLQPRVLRSPQGIDTTTELLGKAWPTPLLAAPMAQLKLAHPDGEAAMALATSALGCGMVLSQQTNTHLETTAPLALASADRGPLWFQLYHLGDRAATLALAHQAAAAGYEALVLTVDAPIQGVRDRERRHPMRSTPHSRPHWPIQAEPASLTQLLRGAPTWDDVAWMRAHSPLPLLLKGITHPADAVLAAELGVAGLIVSNHGGRVLDTVAPTAECLPAIADQLQGRCTLLVDGGLRRGSDVFKALALGAQGALIGRPLVWGLANGGAAGVAHVLRLLLDELWATMVLCGVASLAQATRDHLKKNGFHLLIANRYCLQFQKVHR